jgi:hypothetical protein
MDGSSRPRAPQPAPPDRAFSFTDWQTNNPTAPPPGDKIDAELDRTNQAVEDVIEWVSTSLNSDGSLVEPPGTDPPPPTGAVAEAEEWAVVSQAWAEHMPDTIPPNILAEMAITGEHWSARWWAKQAADQVQNPDAPDDGFVYGRMAHHWEQVLPLTGGTLDGSLTVLGTPSDGAMHVRSAAEWPGTVYDIDNDTGGAFLRSNREGLARWLVYLGDDAPETGGNQGTIYKISRADDAGNEIDFPIQIDRATGQVLINGIAGGSGSGMTPQQIDTHAYNVVADYQQIGGPVSWSGSTITVAGANFTSTDIGKTLVVPFGGGGVGPDAPALVHILSVTNPTTVVVDAASAHAFSGAASVIADVNPVVTTPGAGGALVGDLLTVQGGVFARPAVFYTLQVTAAGGTAVDLGRGGTPGSTVYLRGTTGHGRRALFSGVVDSLGALTPGSLTLIQAGALYQNMVDPANEPLAADQRSMTLPCSWSPGTQLTINSAVFSTVLALVRIGMEVVASGIPQGTVVTAIDGVNPYLLTLSRAALSTGNFDDVRFVQNSVKTPFSATFSNNSTTVTAVAPLPGWVPIGTLIYGVGIVGGADPTASSAAQTTITAIDATRTILTISHPTTIAAPTPVFITMNPILTGVIANIVCVPVVVKLKDQGVYSTLPPGPAFAVTGGANTGVTITAVTDVLRVGCGTDNNAPLAAWSAAVRNAVAAQLVQGNIIGAGIEAIWRPGLYFSTGSINLVGLQAQGLFLKFAGAVLHSAAAGKVAIDFRASRFYVLDHPTIVGNRYFPPLVGLAVGRFDSRLASDAHIRSPFCWGSYSFAGMTIQSSESTVVSDANVQNGFVPISPTSRTSPGFGIVVDGWQHWNLPCDFGTITLTPDAKQSFNDLRLSRVTAQGVGGGIPWSIGGTNGLRVLNGYSASWGAPGVLWFGDADATAHLEIHCEAKVGSAGGVQDAILLAAISNPILQFNATFIDYSSQARNALFAYDKEGSFGIVPSVFQSHRGRVDVEALAGPEVQVFDCFPGTMAGGSIWGGYIYVGFVAYTAVAHLAVQPATLYGQIMLGDSEQDINIFGYIHADSGLIRGSLTVDADANVYGQVSAKNGVAMGDPNFPQGTLTFDGTNVTSTRPISLPTGSVAVTQAPGDADTSVATTAFVQAAATAAAGAIVLPAPATTTPLVEGVGAPGTLLTYARADHVHPASQGAVINTQTIAAVTANTITVPAGTNHILVQDSLNAVNTLTVGSGTLADGYDMWLHFPNGGNFAGVPLSAHGNLTLKVFAGNWSILAKFG